MDKRRQMMAEALKEAVERAKWNDFVVKMSTEVAMEIIEMLGASGAAGATGATGASGSGYADRVAAQAPPLRAERPCETEGYGNGYADRVAAQAPPLRADGRLGMAERREQVMNSLAEGIRFVESRGYGGTAHVMNDALELLKEQPEIVRCGECIRRASYDCPIYEGGDGMHDEPDDWFCGDGERRV